LLGEWRAIESSLLEESGGFDLLYSLDRVVMVVLKRVVGAVDSYGKNEYRFKQMNNP
jgi:hypothetical protein